MTIAHALAMLIVAGVLASTAVDAQTSTAQANLMMAENDSALVADIERTNRLCDTGVAAKFDWAAAALVDLESAPGGTAARHCGEVLEAMRGMCRAADGKAAVRAQIRAVTCGFGGSQPAISLADGTLRYQIDLGSDQTGIRLGVSRYLSDHLVSDGRSLAVRHAMELDEESLATSLRETNKVCNSGLTARFDWTGMSPDEVKDRYASTHCERALDGIRRTCVDEPGRNAVKAQIKGVVCGFGATRSVRLKDGALDYKMDFNSFNDAITVFEYLQGNL